MSVELRLKKCLDDAVAQKKLSRAGADEAIATIRRLLAGKPNLTEGEAAAAAAEAMTAEAARKKRVAALSVVKARELLDRMQARPAEPYQAVSAMLVRDPTADFRGRQGGPSVEGRTRAVQQQLHGMVADLLDSYRSKNLGLTRDAVGLRSLIRETFGDSTGDAAAAAAAKAFGEAAEYARQRFNAAGGAIAKRADWGRPQVWDQQAVKTAGLARFSDDMHEAMAKGWLRIVDFDSGADVPAERAAEIIKGAYDRISSNGLSDLVPGQAGTSMLANRRSDPRVFQWTSSEAWFWANGRYGRGNDGAALFGLLVGHLDGMARDIGLMEVLGPNPAHTARVLIDTARKAGATDSQAHRLESQWEVVSGLSNTPVNEAVASFMRETRAFLTSAKLGSAALSAVTDLATLRQTAAWNGIPAAKVISRYLSMLNPANAADRLAAVRAGITAEAWARAAVAAQRQQADIVGTGLASRAADTVLRASGLAAHTQAGRMAFQVEFLSALGEHVARPLQALPEPMRKGLARHGVGEAEWSLIRAAPLFDDRGMRMIHPEAIARTGRDGAEAAGRLMQLVITETDFAIPQPGAYERALLLDRTRPGTIAGEFWRSASQFKSFPVTMLTTHLMRGLEAYRGGDHGLYLVALGASLTVMGALAMQMKDIARGRDPRDMTKPQFWGAAFMQGGGAGIFGDFLYAGLNRADQSFWANVAGGPLGGTMDDLARLTLSNVRQASEGKNANFGGELVRFMRFNAPGTSLWYGRLALDRLLWDRLQEMADPNAARSWRQTEARAWKEQQQSFWWRPGAAAPPRGPDLSAIAGARQ